MAEDYAEAEAWSKAPAELLGQTNAAARFQSELGAVPTVPADVRTLFRGRRDDGTLHGWMNMGPAPAASVAANRYNRAGEPVLYLATSRDGVRFEIARDGCPVALRPIRSTLHACELSTCRPRQNLDLSKAVFDCAEAGWPPTMADATMTSASGWQGRFMKPASTG